MPRWARAGWEKTELRVSATDPSRMNVYRREAEAGTIRKEFAESIEANSVHGSDSVENAAIEIGQNFTDAEIVG